MEAYKEFSIVHLVDVQEVLALVIFVLNTIIMSMCVLPAAWLT